jgi:hypothetical protein
LVRSSSRVAAEAVRWSAAVSTAASTNMYSMRSRRPVYDTHDTRGGVRREGQAVLMGGARGMGANGRGTRVHVYVCACACVYVCMCMCVRV